MTFQKETQNKSRACTFIVEDDILQAIILGKMLTSLGYKIVGKTTSGEKAIQLAIELKPDLIFMDISLDGKMDGITAAKKIQERISVNLIYITGNADEYHKKRARETHFLDFIIKPATKGILQSTLEKLNL